MTAAAAEAALPRHDRARLPLPAACLPGPGGPEASVADESGDHWQALTRNLAFYDRDARLAGVLGVPALFAGCWSDVHPYATDRDAAHSRVRTGRYSCSRHLVHRPAVRLIGDSCRCSTIGAIAASRCSRSAWRTAYFRSFSPCARGSESARQPVVVSKLDMQAWPIPFQARDSSRLDLVLMAATATISGSIISAQRPGSGFILPGLRSPTHC